MGLHLTSGSTAYLEGMWVWLADHDLDGDGSSQLTIFSGRGIYSQSQGPVWLIGTAGMWMHFGFLVLMLTNSSFFFFSLIAEHHVLYQYHLDGAANHYMGLIQTETPYYQPTPAPPTPFLIDNTYNDPSPASDSSAAWGLYVQSSTDIIVFGAGHYSFYVNYGQDCLTSVNCQAQIVNVDSASSITIYSLATVGVTSQLSVSETGIIPESANDNGFQETVTVWSP
jgi:glucan 1,3-beta-glucosidase